MMDHWEIIDLYKTLLAMAAGILLGMERELKDKAAGLKTITIICLGSALFAIISYKAGLADHNTTRIASYIVSGIGFIGAGVIFKDGVNISGLTTAGIIWLSAAVGTAIGFGEFYLALTFMLASLTIVLLSPWMNKVFKAKKQSRILIITLKVDDLFHKEEILSTLRNNGVALEEKRLELKDGHLVISLDTNVQHSKSAWLEEYLLKNEQVASFILYNAT